MPIFADDFAAVDESLKLAKPSLADDFAAVDSMSSIDERGVITPSQKERRRNDLRSSVEQLEMESRAREYADRVGPLSNVIAGAGQSIDSTRRAIGIGSPDADPGIQAASESSAINSPGYWGDIQRGAGGIAADIPLMLAGGPLGRMAKGSQVLGRAAPIVQYMAPVAAASQPLALREGVNSAQQNGVANGVASWAIETLVPSVFGETGVERALIGKMTREQAANSLRPIILQNLSRSGIAEGAEELATELSHAIHESASGIDPTALNGDKLTNRLAVAFTLGTAAGAGFNVPGEIQSLRESALWSEANRIAGTKRAANEMAKQPEENLRVVGRTEEGRPIFDVAGVADSRAADDQAILDFVDRRQTEQLDDESIKRQQAMDLQVDDGEIGDTAVRQQANAQVAQVEQFAEERRQAEIERERANAVLSEMDRAQEVSRIRNDAVANLDAQKRQASASALSEILRARIASEELAKEQAAAVKKQQDDVRRQALQQAFAALGPEASVEGDVVGNYPLIQESVQQSREQAQTGLAANAVAAREAALGGLLNTLNQSQGEQISTPEDVRKAIGGNVPSAVMRSIEAGHRAGLIQKQADISEWFDSAMAAHKPGNNQLPAKNVEDFTNSRLNSARFVPKKKRSVMQGPQGVPDLTNLRNQNKGLRETVRRTGSAMRFLDQGEQAAQQVTPPPTPEEVQRETKPTGTPVPVPGPANRADQTQAQPAPKAAQKYKPGDKAQHVPTTGRIRQGTVVANLDGGRTRIRFDGSKVEEVVNDAQLESAPADDPVQETATEPEKESGPAEDFTGTLEMAAEPAPVEDGTPSTTPVAESKPASRTPQTKPVSDTTKRLMARVKDSITRVTAGKWTATENTDGTLTVKTADGATLTFRDVDADEFNVSPDGWYASVTKGGLGSLVKMFKGVVDGPNPPVQKAAFIAWAEANPDLYKKIYAKRPVQASIASVNGKMVGVTADSLVKVLRNLENIAGRGESGRTEQGQSLVVLEAIDEEIQHWVWQNLLTDAERTAIRDAMPSMKGMDPKSRDVMEAAYQDFRRARQEGEKAKVKPQVRGVLGKLINRIRDAIRVFRKVESVDQMIAKRAQIWGEVASGNVFDRKSSGAKIEESASVSPEDDSIDDSFDKEQKKALDSVLDDREKATLERLDGTTYAKMARHGALVRAAIRDVIAGKQPKFDSLLNANGVKGVRAAMEFNGEEGIWQYLDAKGWLGFASKPGHHASSSYLDCDPSEGCASNCYAVKGRNYAPIIVRQEIMRHVLNADPKRAGEAIARHYKATGEYAAKKALRINERGDLSEGWLGAIKELNRQGVRVQVFSKRPDLLRRVSDFNLRLLSLDNTNVQKGIDNPDLPIAFVWSGPSDNQFLEQFKGRVQVILPVKLGKKTLAQDQWRQIPKWAWTNVCPVDKGAKKIGIGKDEWMCTKCDVNGGLGCYFKSVTAGLVRDLESGVAVDEISDRIESLKSLTKDLSDDHRKQLLEQLDQLIGNARTISKPGSEVGVNGTNNGGDGRTRQGDDLIPAGYTEADSSGPDLKEDESASTGTYDEESAATPSQIQRRQRKIDRAWEYKDPTDRMDIEADYREFNPAQRFNESIPVTDKQSFEQYQNSADKILADEDELEATIQQANNGIGLSPGQQVALRRRVTDLYAVAWDKGTDTNWWEELTRVVLARKKAGTTAARELGSRVLDTSTPEGRQELLLSFMTEMSPKWQRKLDGARNQTERKKVMKEWAYKMDEVRQKMLDKYGIDLTRPDLGVIFDDSASLGYALDAISEEKGDGFKMSRVLSYYVVGNLLSLGSIAANITGYPMMLGVQTAKAVIQGSYKLLSGKYSNEEMSSFGGAAAAAEFGFKAMMKGLRNGAMSVYTGRNIAPRAARPIEDYEDADKAQSPIKNIFARIAIGPALEVNRFIDEVAWTVAYEGALAASAMEAKMAGDERSLDDIKDSPSETMIRRGAEFADWFTLRDKPKTEAGKKWQSRFQALRDPNALEGLIPGGQHIINPLFFLSPFFNAIARLTVTGAKMSPYGALAAIPVAASRMRDSAVSDNQAVKDVKAAQASSAIAYVMLGGLLAALAQLKYKDDEEEKDVITGSPRLTFKSSDAEAFANATDPRRTIYGKVDYSRWDPGALPLSLHADARDAYRSIAAGEPVGKTLMALGEKAFSAAVQRQFLQGLGDLFKDRYTVDKETGESRKMGVAEKFGENVGGMVAPGRGIASTYNRLTKNEREARGDTYVSKAYGSGVKRVDPFGETEKTRGEGTGEAILGMFTAPKVQPSKAMEKWAKVLADANEQAVDKWTPGNIPGKIDGKRLSVQEYQDFRADAGQRWLELLEKQEDRIQRMKPDVQVRLIEKLHSAALARARAEYRKANR